jgi:xanthine dehydrogenase small subunit
MTPPPLRFVRRGEIVALHHVPPTRTLLELLREDLHSSGTKEGCNEGDCGACTVVLGEADGKRIKYSAVNSCIRLAHSINGLALWTAEDLAGADGALHPVQQALVQNHASQCGFCTPGFVMSLFGTYQNHVCRGETVTRELAQEELSGNLCRCTGYRPILDAAQQMAQLPPVRVDEAALLKKLKQMAGPVAEPRTNSAYMSPPTLTALLAVRSAHPDAQIVAGATDVGLWINKLHLPIGKLLDVTRARELRRIEDYPHHIAIGAAVSLTQAFAALVKGRPQLHAFAARFAGLPVRNSGTLGGNVANGSPIGDSMPLLIALGANVVLMSERNGKTSHREMPLEQLYTGYRKNLMAADEVLAWIKVPKATPGELARVYKISKRFDDDISAVCLAIRLHRDQHLVASVSIGVGGVAATPVRALKTEAALSGQPWTQATVRQAIATLRGEFAPISDMRASSAYRTQVLGNLLQRFWLESQGARDVNLESFALQGVTP